MSRLPGVLAVLGVLVLSIGLAALNGGQLVTLRLGVTTLYGVPLTLVVFGSIIVGMLVMLVAGIHTDLRVRRILRERLAREDEEERARIYVDRNQQDLFDAVEVAEGEGPPPIHGIQPSGAGSAPEPPEAIPDEDPDRGTQSPDAFAKERPPPET